MRPRSAALVALLLVSADALAGRRDVSEAQKLVEAGAYDEALAHIDLARRESQTFEDRQALLALAEEARFQKAELLGTAEAYAAYVAEATDPARKRYADEQVCALAFADAEAQAAGVKAQPLLAYAEQRPQCLQARIAQAEGARMAVAAAMQDGSVAALAEVLNRFPAEAEAAGAPLAWDHAFWSEAEASQAVAPVEAYLLARPQGAHAAEARVVLEARNWEQALATDGVEAIDRFVERFPDSPRVAEVRALKRERLTGWFFVQDEDWVALPEAWAGPGVLIYKPAAPLDGPPELQVFALLEDAAGQRHPTQVLDPRTAQAATHLGVPKEQLRPAFQAEGPGPHGEWTLHLPLALEAWSAGPVQVNAYTLRLSAKGALLEEHTLSASQAEGPFALLRAASQSLSKGQLLEAQASIAVAHAAWTAIPAQPSALTQSTPWGFLMLGYGDPQHAPGSASNAFVPIAGARSGQLGGYRPSSGAPGELRLAGGGRVGAAKLSPETGKQCGVTGYRGQIEIYSGDPSALLSADLFLVSVGDAVTPEPVEAQVLAAQWPGLAARMPSGPEPWLTALRQQAGVSGGPSGFEGHLVDLEGDGLPEMLGHVGAQPQLLRVGPDGGVTPQALPATGSPRLFTDIDHDGIVEVLLVSQSGDRRSYTLVELNPEAPKRVSLGTVGCR